MHGAAVLKDEGFFKKLAAGLNWDGSFAGFVQRTDWLVPLALFALSAWGVAAIFSTGSLHDATLPESDFARKQILFIGLGWAVYWGVALVDYKLFERYAPWLYAFGIALLVPIAVCAIFRFNLSPFIEARLGARRWISFGGTSLQPSEIAKFTTLLILAVQAGRGVTLGQLFGWERVVAKVLWAFIPRKLEGSLPRFLPLIVRMGWLSALPFALIFVQPDLASSLIYVPMVFALLFVANIPLRFFAFLGALVLPFAALLAADMARYGSALETYREQNRDVPKAKDPAMGIRETFKDGILPIRNYQRERIMAFLDRELIDPDGGGKSWQLTQALMAVARGGVSGQGFQNGMLVRLGYLPEAAAHNDFLFASTAEESGFMGGCSIIGLFGLLIGMTLRIAAKARDRFGACLAVGVAIITAVHVVINIGMNIGMLPVAGVPLPLLSYGGSFVLSCFLLFGLVQSVHRSSQPVAAPNTEHPDLLAPSQLAGRAPV